MVIRRNSGYVPCLPEYEGDVSHLFDFNKRISNIEFDRLLKASKKRK